MIGACCSAWRPSCPAAPDKLGWTWVCVISYHSKGNTVSFTRPVARWDVTLTSTAHCHHSSITSPLHLLLLFFFLFICSAVLSPLLLFSGFLFLVTQRFPRTVIQCLTTVSIVFIVEMSQKEYVKENRKLHSSTHWKKHTVFRCSKNINSNFTYDFLELCKQDNHSTTLFIFAATVSCC